MLKFRELSKNNLPEVDNRKSNCPKIIHDTCASPNFTGSSHDLCTSSTNKAELCKELGSHGKRVKLTVKSVLNQMLFFYSCRSFHMLNIVFKQLININAYY